jgi:hypothetical protein
MTAKAFSQEPTVGFNHQIHAEEYQISCRFCHYYADRSPQAGVPSLYDCLGCHQVVKGTTEERQLDIRKLEHLRLFKQPLVWTKVNDLPDFVFFSHQSHTLKGFECETCHGDVAKSSPPTPSGKISELTMQWCVDCHLEEHQSGNQESVIKGTTECHSCHK